MYLQSQKKYLIPWSLLKFTENFLIIAGSLQMKIKSIDYNGLFSIGFSAIGRFISIGFFFCSYLGIQFCLYILVFNTLTCLCVYGIYQICLQKESVRRLRQVEENLKDIEGTNLKKDVGQCDVKCAKPQTKKYNLRMFIHKPTSEIKKANDLSELKVYHL